MTRKLRLWVPRLFIWLLGLIHGKILKTAQIDGQTGVICSGFVTAKLRLFGELASRRVEKLEFELKSVRAEAADLMTEEAFLRRRIKNFPQERKAVTVSEKRTAKRTGAEKSTAAKRYSAILHRLVEIDGKIRSHELAAREELEAVADALRSRFSTYGHGMMLRPVLDSHIPEITFEERFTRYAQTHKREDAHLAKLIEEVYEDE